MMDDDVVVWYYYTRDGKSWELRKTKSKVNIANPELWEIFKNLIESSGFCVDVYDYIDFTLELSIIRNLPFDEQRKRIEELAEEIVIRNLSVPPHLQHHESNTQRRNRTLTAMLVLQWVEEVDNAGEVITWKDNHLSILISPTYTPLPSSMYPILSALNFLASSFESINTNPIPILKVLYISSSSMSPSSWMNLKIS